MDGTTTSFTITHALATTDVAVKTYTTDSSGVQGGFGTASTSTGTGYELTVIAACVIGGISIVLVLGATVLNAGLNNVWADVSSYLTNLVP